MSSRGVTAIFGGTFNPIHFGHLRSALELTEFLGLTSLRFIPARQPPHRRVPAVSAEHRAAMVELAIAGEPRFVCDRRELDRDGPSYTVLTLESLRTELGEEHSLLLTMGCDAVQGLAGWHRWQELLNFAHLVILARPGWKMPATGPVAALLEDRRGSMEQLVSAPAGTVLSLELRPQDVSATAIRGLLQSGMSARYLLPERVLEYIDEHGLYAHAPTLESQ